MRLQDIIRAPKASVVIGGWQSGKVPSSAFQIGKQRRLAQGPAWQWRVISFSALEREFKLLIRLNTDNCYYSSILSMINGETNQIICHHELHLSHLNWHCHFIKGDVNATLSGVLRDRERMKVHEAEPSKRGEVEFHVDELSALNIAAKRFRFDAPDETPAQGLLL